MASSQLIAPLPFFTLDAGCTITVEAIDPATGAAVTGVVVSQVAIYGVNDAPTDTPPDDAAVYYAVLPEMDSTGVPDAA
jgi:hypothetical protein